MALVKFWINSGANSESCNEETIDTVKDWNFEEGEWESQTEDEKEKIFLDWMWDQIDAGWVDLEE